MTMTKQEVEEVAVLRDYSIIKSNEIIQRAKYDLTLQELKILSYCFSMIKPNDSIDTTYTFSIIDFCKVSGIDYQNGKNYRNVKNALTKLLTRVFWMTDPDGSEVSYHWIEKVKIHRGKGKITVRFDEGLKRHIFGLMKNFTQYELLSTLPMQSQYSFRLYELLKSYAFTQEHRFSVDELKTALNATQYKRFADFHVRVIQKAVEEINLYTDIEVSYETITKGRNVASIIFYIRQRDTWGQIEARSNAKNALEDKPKKKKKKPKPDGEQIEGQMQIDDFV
jgi:plasmid replication initiation protein